MTQLAVQPMRINESLPFSLEEVARIIGEGPRNRKAVDNSQGTLGIRGTSISLKQGNLDMKFVQALRNGDEAAFSRLIDQHHFRLLRLARAFVPSEAVAEEVVQETWVGVLEGIDRFEGRSSLQTWIFRILINRAKTRGQRERRYVTLSDAATQGDEESDLTLEPDQFHSSGPLTGHWKMPPLAWDERTPEKLLLAKESLDLIKTTIETLPDNQRQIIILHDIEGIDSEEICKGLNISATNQRVLLHRARAKVRAAINKYWQEDKAKSD